MDYTPTTAEVRERYSAGRYYLDFKDSFEEGELEFDQWLAEHDQRLAARAWDEGARKVVEVAGIEMVPIERWEHFDARPVNPYREPNA